MAADYIGAGEGDRVLIVTGKALQETCLTQILLWMLLCSWDNR